MVYIPGSHPPSHGDLGIQRVSHSTGWPAASDHLSPAHEAALSKQVFSGVELGNKEQCRLARVALLPRNGNVCPCNKSTFTGQWE